MPPTAVDFAGRRFGMLLVIERDWESGKQGTRWKCLCDCGNTVSAFAGSLKSGGTVSCGCKRSMNLTGQRFGKLLVIKKAEKSKNGMSRWECLCDCGKTSIISIANLRRNSSKKTISCGCSRKKYTGEKSAFKSLFQAYKGKAKSRNLPFRLSKQKFKDLTKGKCFYCGQEPNCVHHIRESSRYIFNGIDRINSSKGYINGNVVSCCEMCNKAKSDMSKDEFFIWIKQIHNYSIKTAP